MTCRDCIVENCWKDPHSWKWGVYYCTADPRVIVPKRLKWMGWTMNLARPSAFPIAALLCAMMIVPCWCERARRVGTGIMLITEAASIAAVCLVCIYLSSRKG